MLEQILDLVGQPPGSLVYHFIILFAVEAAFAIAIGQWMRERDSGTLRLAGGIFVILLARVLVLIASLAAWQGYFPRNVLIPPVERAVDTITIIGLSWIVVTMDDPEILRRNFLPDVSYAVLLGITLIGFAGTYYFWSTGTAREQLFNGLWIDIAWAVGQIALCLAAVVWMLTRVRYVYDPFLKGLMVLIPAGAAILHLVQPVLGDVPAAMRVAELIAMPMLAAVAYRHVVEQLLHWDAFEPSRLSETIIEQTRPHPAGASAPATLEQDYEEVPVSAPEVEEDEVEDEEPIAAPALEETPPSKPEETATQPRPTTGPHLLEVIDAVGGLLATLEPAEIVEEAPRAVATALRADVAMLAIVDEDVVNAGIVGGYDNIAQAPLKQAVLDLANHPTIVNALGRLRQMRLTTQRNSRELRDMYRKLQIMHEGPAYIQPLVDDDDRIGALIVGSPYSGRYLSNDERNLLDRLAPLVTAALLNTEKYKDTAEIAETISVGDEVDEISSLNDALTARTAELHDAQRQIDEMKAYIRDVHRRLEELPQQQEVARSQLESLSSEADKLRKESDELRTEIQRLRETERRAEDLEDEVIALRRHIREHEARPTTGVDEAEVERRVEEAHRAAQSELASLRARLATASASQHEITFLQEQVADRAREVVKLQTKLVEADAVIDALQDQVKTDASSTRDLESLQSRVAAQATEITRLQAELLEAQKTASLSNEAVRAGQDMDQVDRKAMAQLEAQLAERSALINALQEKLADRAEAVAELKAHMSEVSASLRNLEEQLTSKTKEVADLQKSLAQTRAEARKRIATLEAALEGGEGTDTTAVEQARIEALEAELAEKASAVETLEEQLDSTRNAMLNLEQQLTSTNRAVDAAISGARAVESHDQVIASIAHELRTPMSSIMGYTELLLRESVGILGPLQRKFLQRVKANTERMTALLDDLIRLTTLDASQIKLSIEKLDVFYAVEEAVESLTDRFNEKSITLRLTLPEQIPPLSADRNAFQDILRHLLSNAVLASPLDGEVELRVESGEDNIPGGNGSDSAVPVLQISVADSGVGIAKKDLDKVFEPDYSANAPLIEGLGDTGAGLSLARSLVEAHGGHIWLDSEADEGTVFYVILPINTDSSGAETS